MRILHESGERFLLDEIEDVLPAEDEWAGAETPPGDWPRPPFAPILEGCAFLRHCVDDAKTLTLNNVTVSGTAIADHNGAGDGIVVVQQTVTLKAGASIDGGDITVDAAATLLVSDADTTSTSATLSNDEVTNKDRKSVV